MSKKNPTPYEQQQQQLNEMRAEMSVNELRARFWKARYETKYYQLQDSQIQGDYDALIERESQKREALIKQQEEMILKLQENGAVIAPVEEEA